MSSHDSSLKTLAVACILCVVCSIVVSGSAVFLSERQNENKVNDKRRNILIAAGLLGEREKAEKAHLNRLFDNIEVKYVDLDSGQYVEALPGDYDQVKAAKDPLMSKALGLKEDIAGIKRREQVGAVYLIKDADQQISRIVMPIRGYGLWSTLYGFLAFETDLKTVAALSFYQHAETPGLGGEVDNPKWKAHWQGKVLFDESYSPKIAMFKGKVTTDLSGHQHKFDALAGATLTSKGVQDLIRFWISDQGYGQYLKQQKSLGV